PSFDRRHGRGCRRPLAHHPPRADGLWPWPHREAGDHRPQQGGCSAGGRTRRQAPEAQARRQARCAGAVGCHRPGRARRALGAAGRHQKRAREGGPGGKRHRRSGGGALMSESLAAGKRLIVKIGSALLVEDATGDIRRAWLEALVEDLVRCRARGQQVLIVSSGAIAVGRRHLGLTDRALKLEEKQAAAATGQIRLAHAYQEALARHGVTVAQILLTPEDTEARRRHLNARATLEQLMELGAVPVINENDTVATTEIRFGDNDRLAARVAQMISADTLVLLSDIDGLYTADPRHDPAARHLPELREITPEIEAMAGESG